MIRPRDERGISRSPAVCGGAAASRAWRGAAPPQELAEQGSGPKLNNEFGRCGRGSLILRAIYGLEYVPRHRGSLMPRLGAPSNVAAVHIPHPKLKLLWFHVWPRLSSRAQTLSAASHGCCLVHLHALPMITSRGRSRGGRRAPFWKFIPALRREIPPPHPRYSRLIREYFSERRQTFFPLVDV